ncbi:MAG: hypothetical protein RLZZ16_805 [Actinomycetota bacterium]|jgi:hypothetical protein
MTGGTTMMFAAAARFLANEAQRFGLDAPGFRSPPRTLGVQRTLRRTEHGGVVAVLVRDRPFVAVLADMIEGVIVVNRLVPPDADTIRTALWESLVEAGFVGDDLDVTTSDTRVA